MMGLWGCFVGEVLGQKLAEKISNFLENLLGIFNGISNGIDGTLKIEHEIQIQSQFRTKKIFRTPDTWAVVNSIGKPWQFPHEKPSWEGLSHQDPS